MGGKKNLSLLFLLLRVKEIKYAETLVLSLCWAWALISSGLPAPGTWPGTRQILRNGVNTESCSATDAPDTQWVWLTPLPVLCTKHSSSLPAVLALHLACSWRVLVGELLSFSCLPCKYTNLCKHLVLLQSWHQVKCGLGVEAPRKNIFKKEENSCSVPKIGAVCTLPLLQMGGRV